MAIPAVLAIAATSGVIASQVPAASNGGPPTDLAWGGGVAILVALIGGAVQIWTNRRRNNEPQLTVETRVAVLEENVAELRRNDARRDATLQQILDHVRPWGSGGPKARR